MSAARTQLDRIIEILERDGQIDNFAAIHQRISLRLGARIYDLRQLGWEFDVHTDEHKNTHYKVLAKPRAETLAMSL
jgi:hypothetical protein